MNKISRMFKSGGIISLLDGVGMILRSRSLRKNYAYGKGFRIGYTTQWINGRAARIGTNFQAGKRCRIEMITEHNKLHFAPSLIIGDNVSINDDVHIGCAYRIEIGNDVLMASKVFISDHQHGGYNGEHQHGPEQPPSARPLVYAPVMIGDRVWIGEMVSVLAGVTIGEGSIIGANSVVSRDIPPCTIAVGSPAKAIKRYNHELSRWERI